MQGQQGFVLENPSGKGTREKKGEGGGSKFEPQLIKMYRVKNKRLTLEDIGNVYGDQNMYRDITSDNCMMFEDLLSRLESSAANIVQVIRSGSQEISMTRTKLMDFKRFLAIMMFREHERRRQYAEDIFDPMTRMSIQRHMRFNNFTNIQDVWFENLKWILKTPTKEITDISVGFDKSENFSAAGLAYQGPIHWLELMDFSNLMRDYVCVWEAPEGTEFILTDNCFGCYEGFIGIVFHTFFIVSPKYAVVLVNRLYMWHDLRDLRESWFIDFHANPEATYSKKGATDPDPEDFTPDDVFKYRRILLPKQKVWLVNSIFLDARQRHISHKSDAALYRSLLFYDKKKKVFFPNRHDYSDLKRKLFAEMNRTHNS
ncbi:hypothetical protein BGZ99_001393 [Dissophora globulifera]|uniref:Uncharacterized protein n=1 Tax=Dissophora globulifera TaxID=979702 RepID=A0A9P6UY32_9FUNG|nr:hypothetical protein BGZ99_001393 [Dissophora globulifera]